MIAKALKDLMRSSGFHAGRYSTSHYFSRIIETNALIGGGRVDYMLVIGEEAKYLPMNEIIVTNLSGQRLNILLDEYIKVIPSNSVVSIPEKFFHIAVINTSTVANSDIIELQFRRKAYLTDIILELLRSD